MLQSKKEYGDYADDELIIYQSRKWIKALTSVCHGWAFSKATEIFSLKTVTTFAILSLFCSVWVCTVRSYCRRTDRIYKWATRWLFTTVAPSRQKTWEKRWAWTNCLGNFAVLFKGICSILTSSSLQAWLAQWNKNIDTLFQQMRNDKCINHSGSVA